MGTMRILSKCTTHCINTETIFWFDEVPIKLMTYTKQFVKLETTLTIQVIPVILTTKSGQQKSRSNHDSHPNKSLYLFILCTHAHSFPIFLLCKLKEGELIHILGCYPWELKSIPLHSMLRWTPGLRGRDKHVYGCQWLTVRPHWIICLYSKLALLEALDWVENFHYFLSSCKPPWGCISNRKNLGWWDLLRVLKL